MNRYQVTLRIPLPGGSDKFYREDVHTVYEVVNAKAVHILQGALYFGEGEPWLKIYAPGKWDSVAYLGKSDLNQQSR